MYDNVKTKSEKQHILFMLKWLDKEKDKAKIKRYKESLKKYEK
jgi:hypothetical protein